MENHGLERQLFERLLKHVICRRFGYDEAIYDMVLQQYTNWDIPMDALENTLQYLKVNPVITSLLSADIDATSSNSRWYINEQQLQRAATKTKQLIIQC